MTDKTSVSRANLDLELEIEIRDKDGNVISHIREQSKSLLKNFALILQSLMAGSAVGVRCFSIYNTKVTLKDTSGNEFTYPNFTTYMAPGQQVPSPSFSAFEVSAYAEMDNYGIVVGTGTAPVSRDDYKLASQIPHGDESGQLRYGEVTVEEVNGNPPSSVWRVIRTFTNEGDSSIDVREIGLVAQCGGKYVLIARDVLSSAQTVPALATLTVRYIFTVTA